MNIICNKEEFSLYKNIDSLEKTIDKKKYKMILENLKNTISEIYSINKNKIDFTNEIDKIENFLQKAGILSSDEKYDKLKNILKGDEFHEFISIILKFINLNLKEKEYDINLLKYMDFYRKKILEESLGSNSPTLVDLFCGAGGLSLGFIQNGFRSILANDIEQVCIDTYRFNHLELPKSKAKVEDIKNISENIETYIKEKVDVIVGGPPCQSFSTANRQRIIDDPRNILYTYYVKIVEKLKPKFFIMENVKGMLEVANQVVEDFQTLKNVDYDVAYKVFNGKDFSVPQNRERLIYIGVRKDLGISSKNIIDEIYSKTQNMKKYTLKDAINDLRELKPFTLKNATELDTVESGKKIEKNKSKEINDYLELINNNKYSSLIFNHKTRYNNDRDIEIYSRMLPGDKSDSPRIADIMPYKNREHIFKDKYYKLKEDDICKAITAHMKFDCNMYIHPTQSRGLTPREAARVQSYPDNYFFLGPYTKTYMQIGNSVPPLMSRLIGEVIKKNLVNR
ncbi:DNA (cytosine-5)-methyltransferase 1 [Cetobacterium ceti]|uniref:Cytosine-specific methyltransferase n=1 Tax=Cetobacterium ceti TaxID=180163 RepID=A0A1T4QNE8_9FUSO|nr:DNA cytosine methyltransferase [Cetobacterium ceti]SKA04778.1 DNA (cytosine-5)-methyltransferase 1 [Cetobacterium ceti]